MTNIVGFSDTVRSAMVNGIKTTFDQAATASKMLIYTAPRPSKGAAITTQTLLGTIPLNKPCGTVLNGVLTLDVTSSQDTSADATGTAAWVRFVDGDNVFLGDGDAGNSTSTSVAKFNTTDIVSGVPIILSSATITAPI